jgi:hypothetical protein
VVALVLVVVLALDLGTAVLPWWLRGDDRDLPAVAALALSLLPLTAYIAAIAGLSRGTTRRTAAVTFALVAAGLHVAAWFASESYGRLRGLDDERLDRLAVGLITLLLVAAWCAARRSTHAWWWLGPPAVAALVVVQSWLQSDFYVQVWDWSFALYDGTSTRMLLLLQGALWWIWATLPLLGSGLICWLGDWLLEGGREVR